MSYRRHQTDNDAEWKDWIKKHSHLVNASGLPDLVLRDADHWYDFLDHGMLDHHEDLTGFSLEQLSVRQKAALLRLLLTWPSMLNTVTGTELIIATIEAVERRYKQ